MSGFSLLVASRYTLSRGQSQLLGFISKVSIIGLVLAVSILILVLSVMNGFDKALREQILALVPHATLTSQQPVLDWHDKLKLAQQLPQVSYAEPFISAQVLTVHGKAVQAGLLYGVEPDYARHNAMFNALLSPAVIKALEHDKQLIIGKNLAHKLALKKGDSVRIVLASHGQQASIQSVYFTVAGILHSGTELDSRLLISSRKNVALLKQYPADAADGLRIQVQDLFQARRIANQLAMLTGLPTVRDWTQSQGNLYQAIQTSRKLVVLLVLIIIAVAAFNVVSTLVLAVNDKAADIAILRTMGASNRQILAIFIAQGSLIGAIGVTLGLLIGLLLSATIGDIVGALAWLFHTEFISSTIYPVDHLPSVIHWSGVFWVALASLSLSVLASLFPAWQASRLQPARILRYE